MEKATQWEEGRTGARELVAEVWQPFSAGVVLQVLETFLTAASECHFHLSVLAFLPPGAQLGQQECFGPYVQVMLFPQKEHSFLAKRIFWPA